MEIDKTSLDNYITGNYGEDEQRLQEKRYGTKVKTMLFDLEEVREAVDITIGDDGFRSKEVIEILKVLMIRSKVIKKREFENNEE